VFSSLINESLEEGRIEIIHDYFYKEENKIEMVGLAKQMRQMDDLDNMNVPDTHMRVNNRHSVAISELTEKMGFDEESKDNEHYLKGSHLQPQDSLEKSQIM